MQSPLLLVLLLAEPQAEQKRLPFGPRLHLDCSGRPRISWTGPLHQLLFAASPHLISFLISRQSFPRPVSCRLQSSPPSSPFPSPSHSFVSLCLLVRASLLSSLSVLFKVLSTTLLLFYPRTSLGASLKLRRSTAYPASPHTTRRTHSVANSCWKRGNRSRSLYSINSAPTTKNLLQQ